MKRSKSKMLFVSSEILRKLTRENWVRQTLYLLDSLSLFFIETPLQVWEVTEKNNVIFLTHPLLSPGFQKALNMDSTAQSNDFDC